MHGAKTRHSPATGPEVDGPRRVFRRAWVFRHNSYLYRILFLLVAFTLVIALLNTVHFIRIRGMVRDLELEAQRTYISYHLERSIDEEFRNVVAGMYVLKSDSDIIAWMSSADLGSPGYAYSNLVERITSRLSTVAATSSLVQEIFLIRDQFDMVFKSDGTVSMDVFFYNRYREDIERWKSQLAQRNRFSIGIYPQLVKEPTPSFAASNLLVLDSVLLDGRKIGTVVLFIDEEQLARVISASPTGSGATIMSRSAVHVLNREKQILASTDRSLIGSLYSTELVPSESMSTQGFRDDGENLVLFAKFSLVDVSYLIVTPKHLLYDQISRQFGRINLTLALFLILSVLFAAIVTKRIYAPIAELADFVSEHHLSESMTRRQGDEIQLIGAGLSEVVSLNTSLKKTLKRGAPLITEFLLHRMLHDASEDEFLHGFIRTYGIRFCEGWYAVLSVFSETTSDATHIAPQLQHVIPSVETNSPVFRILAALRQSEGVTAMVIYREKSVDEAAFRTALLELARSLIEPGLHLFCVLGRRVSSAFGLSVSNQDAADLVGRRAAKDIGPLITEESASVNVKPVVAATDFEQQLTNYVVCGNRKMTEASLVDLFERNLKRPVSFCDFPQLCVSLANLYFRITGDWSSEPTDGEVERAERVRRATLSMNASSMATIMTAAFGELAGHIGRRRAPNETIDTILEYVNSHFTEDIYLESVAEEFRMTPNYFTKYFKRNTGVTFSHYIHSMRIDRAKLLLESTDAKVKDIASQVGYHSSNIFLREFRKYEGISPGQHRRLQLAERRKGA